MDLFAKLAAAAQRKNEEADLPCWLVADILQIAREPERYAGRRDLVEQLLRQVEDFDSYAGAGCFGDSVSAETIRSTLEEMAG